MKKRPSARERGQEPATVGEGGSIEDVPDREVLRESRASGVSDAKPQVEEDDPRAPKMHSGFERIVRSIYEVDVEEVYARIRDLRLPVSIDHATRETIRAALERAEECARDAHLLFCNARVALEGFEAESDTTMGVLRAAARDRLFAEYEAARDPASKTKPKQLTDADVDAEVARSYSDAVRRYRVRREERKRMVDHLEQLASIWRSRRSTLEALLESARL